MIERTGKLPGDFKNRYKSINLKNQIEDIGMWGMIPAVNYKMDSPKGIKRLEKNHTLFAFIDEYFGDAPFAFEPNMMDDRYVFLPAEVDHQGIGIAVSSEIPGFLEIAHFWYPCEFTRKTLPIGGSQVYVSNFCMKPGEELAQMVNNIYMNDNMGSDSRYCTFPFSPELVVTLTGNFLDRTSQSVKIIRDSLKNAAPEVRRNGEGFIDFIQSMME